MAKYTESYKDYVKRKIDHFLKAKIIGPSNSPLQVLVEKDKGKHCMVFDYS